VEDLVRQIEQYSIIRRKNAAQEPEHLSSESLRVIRGKIGQIPVKKLSSVCTVWKNQEEGCSPFGK
jgi:hypothetical protein